MSTATTTAFILILFLSISYPTLSFPVHTTAGSAQTATDFLNYIPPAIQPPVDDQSITGLLPQLPVGPTVAVPVESGNEPSENVAAPTVGAPIAGGDEPSETVGAPTVGIPVEGGKETSDTDATPTVDAPAKGGNEPSEAVAAPTVRAPVGGGNEPSPIVIAPSTGAPIVGAVPVGVGNEPTEGSEGSSVSEGVEEQEPSDNGSPGLLAPFASPNPSTPAATAPFGGLNGPFGQRQRQQQLEGSVNGEERDLGAQPLVDNTPFDSASTKMGYFSLFDYIGVATIASIGLLV